MGIFDNYRTLQNVLNAGNEASNRDVNLDSGQFFYHSATGITDLDGAVIAGKTDLQDDVTFSPAGVAGPYGISLANMYFEGVRFGVPDAVRVNNYIQFLTTKTLICAYNGVNLGVLEIDAQNDRYRFRYLDEILIEDATKITTPVGLLFDGVDIREIPNDYAGLADYNAHIADQDAHHTDADIQAIIEGLPHLVLDGDLKVKQGSAINYMVLGQLGSENTRMLLSKTTPAYGMWHLDTNKIWAFSNSYSWAHAFKIITDWGATGTTALFSGNSQYVVVDNLGNAIYYGNMRLAAGKTIGIGTEPVANIAVKVLGKSTLLRAPYSSYYLWWQDDAISAPLIMHSWAAGLADHLKFTALASNADGPDLLLCRGADYHLVLQDINDNIIFRIDVNGNVFPLGEVDGVDVSEEPARITAEIDADVAVVNTLVEQQLAIGSGNALWINCPYEGAEFAAGDKMRYNGQMEAYHVAGAGRYVYSVPLPTTRGGKSLYINGTRVSLADADGSNRVYETNLYGMGDTTATELDSDPTNKNSIALWQDLTMGNENLSGYDVAKVILKTAVATAGNLKVQYVTVRYYYA